MAIWDSFLNTVKGLGRDIIGEGAQVSSTALSAGTNIGLGQIAGQTAVQAPAAAPTMQQLENTAQQAIATSAATVGATPNSTSGDLLLKASQPVAAAIRPVTRAVTAGELLTDPGSPLYQKGQGLDLTNLKKAYDQSAKVSPFQALTKSSIFQDSVFGKMTDKVLAATGHIDVQGVNLWNQQDIKKNYVDNPVGKWFTGVGDFIEGNAITDGAAGAVSKTASIASRAAGVSNDINGVADLDRMNADADSHILAMQNENAGTKTNFGATVEKLASSTDLGEIQRTISKFTNNDALPNLIASTNNPSVVKDLLLADKGYQPSFQRLMDTGNADYLWQVGDTNSFIKGHVASTGEIPKMTDQAMANANKAYDASIQRVPAHQEIYEAFMDGKGNQVVQGTKYKPIDPPLLGGVIGSVRTRASEINAALGVNSFDNLGGVAETVLGNGAAAPITKLIHWLGSEKPRGYVTYQGLRPWDGIKELNAVFDDTKLLRDGTNDVTVGYDTVDGKPTPITMKATDYRRQAINDFINAKDSVSKDAVIQRVNTDLAKHLFYSNGIANDARIKEFVTANQNRLSDLHTQLSKTGFATDVDGSRLAVDPKTQRQLADSRSMLPFGQIEREIKALSHGQFVGKSMLLPHDITNTVFEALQKGFSAATLGRLAYIPKNGYLEPLTTSFLSHGLVSIEDGATSFAANIFKNTKNRVMQAATKIADLPAKANINKLVDAQMDNLNQAIKIRDDHQAAYEEAFNTDNLSPAAKYEHAETIKSNLRTADNLVRRIESDIAVASKQYGVSEKIPSIYNLKQRIQFLKDQPLGQIQFASEIKTAETAVAKAIENINTLSPEIHVRDAAVAKAWKTIENAVQEKGLADAEQAAIIDRSAKYVKRYYGGEKPIVIDVNGKPMTVDSLLDPNQFGDAIKNEFSNAAAIETTFLNETRIGAKQGIFARKSPTGITDVDSPRYYDELAYVINRQMRGDPLIDQALRGDDPKSIVQWAMSQEGKRYMRQFGYSTEADIRSAVQDRLNFVNRYIPDQAVQRLAYERTVNDNDLRKLLADKQNLLSPIHPTDVNYGDAATGKRGSLLGAEALKISNAAFGFLMRAENPLRWLWSNREFAANVEYKLNILAKQGVDVTTEQANAVRQAAAREALTEHEKTFYTVRRQNKAIYASRAMLSFPAAGFSAMQRFAHLAVKNPARFTNYLRNYYGYYSTFGVDKDGNPVSNPADAAYVLVPGTKEMGLFGDKGVRLSAKTMGWMVSAPGPSWLATFAVNRILNEKPSNEQVLKTVWDNSVGKIPGMKYDDMFPSVGAGTSATSAFIPSFVSDFMKYLNGSDSNADFLNTHKMVNNYQMTMWEMGLGKKPTQASIMSMTKEYYLQKALWAFGSPFGASPQQDRPGQMFQDLGTALLKKYNGNFDQAQTEMQAILGPSFPADRYLYRGSSKSAYIAPNLDAYKRVFQQNSGLVQKLSSLDPVTVGLLSADLSGDPQNVQVQAFLQNPKLKLPGGQPVNNAPMTTQEYEDQIQINRTWNAYRSQKAQLLAAVQAAGYKRLADSPQASAIWNAQIAKFGQYDPKWYTEYQANAAGDKSYIYAQGLSDIVKDKAFMKQNAKSDFWKQAATFIDYRDKVVAAYNSPEASANKAKTAIKTAWQTYLNETTAGKWNPQLQQIIDRYFISDNMKAVQ